MRQSALLGISHKRSQPIELSCGDHACRHMDNRGSWCSAGFVTHMIVGCTLRCHQGFEAAAVTVNASHPLFLSSLPGRLWCAMGLC